MNTPDLNRLRERVIATQKTVNGWQEKADGLWAELREASPRTNITKLKKSLKQKNNK